MADIRTQASLGTEFRRLYNEDSNIDRIMLAEVIKVNYRYNTVDVRTTDGNMQINKSGQSEGRYSAKLPIEFGGRTGEGKPFGQINPIEVGSLVLLGFLSGKKAKPIVISVYGRADETKELSRAPFAGADPREEDLKKYTQHNFTVYPSLTYDDIDGSGNRTMSFPGKSFVTIDADSVADMSGVSDDGDGHGYEDLESSYYYSGELIEPKNGKAPTILFKHVGEQETEQGVVDDPHAFMMFLGQDGTYRTSMVNTEEDWRSYIEMTPEGDIKLRRQNDSKAIGQGQVAHELSVVEDGILFRSGSKYMLFNQDGVETNTGFGGGSSETDFDALKKRLEEAEGNILSMGTYFERTDEAIRMGAEKTVELEGQLIEMDASFEIRADQIKSEVTETVTGMIDSGLADMSQDLTDLQKDALEALELLGDLSEDGIITPLEKQTLLREWDMIKAEYPGYRQQAVVIELATTSYDKEYGDLETYLAPILLTTDTNSTIDREVFNSHFTSYYTSRGNLLYGVFSKLKEATDIAAKNAIEAAKDAGQALTDASLAHADARAANQLLADIASDGIITPQEKSQLRREYEELLAEWEGYVDQAIPYELSTLAFEEAKDEVVSFIESTGIFANLNESVSINGAQLQQVFATYYTERSNLLTLIGNTAKAMMDNFKGDLEYYGTSITETAREIALVADSVKMLGKDVEINSAKISVQADKIVSKVSKVEFSRELDETMNRLNSVGRNMYIMDLVQKGTINIETGELSNPTNEDETSVFIPVTATSPYTATIFENKRLNIITIAWYDASKKFLGVDQVSGSEATLILTATSPNNAAYARVTTQYSSSVDILFEKGSVTTPYKAAPEDIVADITVATEEKKNREEMVNYYTQRGQALRANGLVDLASVESWVANELLDYAEKPKLKELWEEMVKEYPIVLGEAGVYSVATSSYQGSYISLEAFLTNIFAEMGSSSPVTKTTLPTLFKNYFEQRNTIYLRIVEKTTEALEATIELLDQATKSALEAQELSRRMTADADAAARSVSATQINISRANQEESRVLKTVDTVIQDSLLTPLEKVEMTAIVEALAENVPSLIVQANVYSLSTSDIENANMSLDAYYSAMITAENVGMNTTIAPQTFKMYFQNFFDARATMLQNILDGARGVYDKAQVQASHAQEEYLRRQEQMIIYENAVKDSQYAIERITDDIEMLTDNIVYSYRITSSNGVIFKDNNINTTLTAQLFKGNTDITTTVKPQHFVWTKTNADGTKDTAWNLAHVGAGSEIHLTEADVQEKAVFDIEIFTEEEE